ncbi:MAG: hypothetical protein K9I71_02780 [Ignavibacteriales bacterium]|nr:hypothetical protein [Ignavibacteriales bacterium]MCF8435988.1 hypothetical protein [Ignavibacteriales bacterium]
MEAKNPEPKNAHEEISRVLSGLPKINAPENFEFNLMTRIQNGAYENARWKVKNPLFTPWRLVPAAAGLAAIVLMFLIFPDQDTTENLLMTDPPARAAAVNASPDTMHLRISSKAGNKSDQTLAGNKKATENKDKAAPAEETFRVVVNPNDAVTKEKLPFEFNDSRSVDLDSYLGGHKSPAAKGGRGVLVSSGNSMSADEFDGFIMSGEMEKLPELKARMDSIMLEYSKQKEKRQKAAENKEEKRLK